MRMDTLHFGIVEGSLSGGPLWLQGILELGGREKHLRKSGFGYEDDERNTVDWHLER